MTNTNESALIEKLAIELDDEVYERIKKTANLEYIQYSCSIRGQQMTKWDDTEYHIANVAYNEGFNAYLASVTAGEAVAVLALNITELKKRIATLEDLLSSACNIANREGADTHWQRYAGQLHINGISPVTAKTFKILPSDTDYKPASQARIEQLEADNTALIHDNAEYVSIANEQANEIMQLEADLKQAREMVEHLNAGKPMGDSLYHAEKLICECKK